MTLVIDTKGRGGGKKGSVFLCESGDDKILYIFRFSAFLENQRFFAFW